MTTPSYLDWLVSDWIAVPMPIDAVLQRSLHNTQHSIGRLVRLISPQRGRTVWESKDHPELAESAADWVRKLRTESDAGKPRKRGPHTRTKAPQRTTAGRLCGHAHRRQCARFDLFDPGFHPPIGFVSSLHAQLEVIFGKSFGGLAVEDVQRDRVNRPSRKSLHEGQLFRRSQIAQNPIAFASNLHGNLISHRRR